MAPAVRLTDATRQGIRTPEAKATDGSNAAVRGYPELPRRPRP